MIDLWKKHKRKAIVFGSAVVLFLAAKFGLGVEVDLSELFSGDLSGLADIVDGDAE